MRTVIILAVFIINKIFIVMLNVTVLLRRPFHTFDIYLFGGDLYSVYTQAPFEFNQNRYTTLKCKQLVECF